MESLALMGVIGLDRSLRKRAILPGRVWNVHVLCCKQLNLHWNVAGRQVGPAALVW